MAGSRELASRYTETMTIDERLEKLTERHEALTQTVELIAAMQLALTRDVQQDSENIRALARIAEIHDRRLTEMEGGE
jgi:uncharacterized protein HemY